MSPRLFFLLTILPLLINAAPELVLAVKITVYCNQIFNAYLFFSLFIGERVQINAKGAIASGKFKFGNT